MAESSESEVAAVAEGNGFKQRMSDRDRSKVCESIWIWGKRSFVAALSVNLF